MIRRLLLAAALVVAAPVATAPAQPPAAAPADWARHVEATAEGGYRMGNPDAPVKLVEYGSITCSHCAEFAEHSVRWLQRDLVRSGRVSFEYRPYVLFPSDPGIFMLLACQAPDRFFATVDALYASQESWVEKLQAQQAQIEAEVRRSSFPAAIPAIVRATGVDRTFRDNGLSQQQIDACLADRSGLDRLGRVYEEGNRLGVAGTPTFFVNGRMVEVASWSELEALLRRP